MKKKISILGLVFLLIFSFSGCGKKAVDKPEYDKEAMTANVERVVETFQEMSDEEFAVFEDMPDVQLTLTMVTAGLPIEGDDFLSMIEAWKAGEVECGKIKAIKDARFEELKTGASVTLDTEFENRDGEIIVNFDEKMNMESMTVNAHYSIGEILEKAGLNTILGMGTVFVVLIFISFIIYLFKYIPVLEQKLSRKSKKTAPAQVKTSTPVVEEVEEAGDDEELIAVIAAAIAAAEGTSTDGFVVRSIKRRKTNRW